MSYHYGNISGLDQKIKEPNAALQPLKGWLPKIIVRYSDLSTFPRYWE